MALNEIAKIFRDVATLETHRSLQCASNTLERLKFTKLDDESIALERLQSAGTQEVTRYRLAITRENEALTK